MIDKDGMYYIQIMLHPRNSAVDLQQEILFLYECSYFEKLYDDLKKIKRAGKSWIIPVDWVNKAVELYKKYADDFGLTLEFREIKPLFASELVFKITDLKLAKKQSGAYLGVKEADLGDDLELILSSCVTSCYKLVLEDLDPYYRQAM